MEVLARACGHDSPVALHPDDLTTLDRDVADLVGVALRRGRSDERRDRPTPTRATTVAQGRRRRRARRGPGHDRDRGRPPGRPHPLRRARTARSTTTARTRAARSARARSRTGWLRCPWHGYDYDPLTGTPPAGLHRRARGVPGRGARRRRLRRSCPTSAAARRTVSDVHGRDDGRVGRRRTCSAWSATPTSGSPTRCAARRSAASSRYIGIRHEGAAAFAASAYGKLTGRPAACFAIAGPGLDQPAHRPVRRQGRPAPRCSRSPARCRRRCSGRGAFQDLDLDGRVRRRRASPRRPCTPDSDHAELMTLAVKHARRRARRRAPRAPRRGAGRCPRRRAAPRRPAGRRADLRIAPPAPLDARAGAAASPARAAR